MSASETASLRGDVRLARYNVCMGVESLWPERDRLARELVTLDLARVWSLPDLARGLVYATKMAERKPVSKGELGEKSTLISTPRTEMLRLAEALSRRGVFPEDALRSLPKGAGRIDVAEDVLALVELYCDPKYKKALAGKHPFTPAEFERWREAAEFLLNNLRPAGARRVKPEATPAERDVLRLWTLLERGYEPVRRAGVWLWGEGEVDQHVPRLLSRARPGTVLSEAGDDEPVEPDPQE